MPFTIVRQDITRMNVDAIVNAANTELAMGGGVCGAIFRAAGAAQLQAACRRVAPIRTGEAAITPSFGLPARYVIHAAGPVYSAQESQHCAQLLRSAYTSSLELAQRHGCESVAFPLISSGIYGYPRREALRVATAAIADFLTAHDMDVYLAIFDRASFEVGAELIGAIDSYIDENYVRQHEVARFERAGELNAAPMCAAQPAPLDELVNELDEPFHVALLRLIDARGRTDAEVYKRANIDRKLFSKIRKGRGYMPSKRTALALAIALELDLAQTRELLARAGYALSHSQKFDVIVEYFIVNGRYDIFEINEALFEYDQPLLGSN